MNSHIKPPFSISLAASVPSWGILVKSWPSLPTAPALPALETDRWKIRKWLVPFLWMLCNGTSTNQQMAVCQNLVPLVNIKIAGKWMFIPLKMVLIGIDPYPDVCHGGTQARWKVFFVENHGEIDGKLGRALKMRKPPYPKCWLEYPGFVLRDGPWRKRMFPMFTRCQNGVKSWLVLQEHSSMDWFKGKS